MLDQRVTPNFPTDAERPPGPINETAALVGETRHGGVVIAHSDEAAKPHWGEWPKPVPVASVRLAGCFNDDGCLFGREVVR